MDFRRGNGAGSLAGHPSRRGRYRVGILSVLRRCARPRGRIHRRDRIARPRPDVIGCAAPARCRDARPKRAHRCAKCADGMAGALAGDTSPRALRLASGSPSAPSDRRRPRWRRSAFRGVINLALIAVLAAFLAPVARRGCDGHRLRVRIRRVLRVRGRAETVASAQRAILAAHAGGRRGTRPGPLAARWSRGRVWRLGRMRTVARAAPSHVRGQAIRRLFSALLYPRSPQNIEAL